ncbi:heme-binding protein [Tenacibaculum skagerrakense]|uniref:Heme-binding protein n=1 Tax=Tenacibaculum skagerrakense TaxID=186571 RepID=A0A4V2SMT6_9FLAO|nr:heme-binding domain-containing protein [Tenacibaculum skagerrakense]TCP28546.1 heme-binding protein [Tenacibaculum skagerrakense]
MKIVKKIGWVALGLLLIIQFIPTEKNNGELSSLDAFVTETKPSQEVQKILKNACYDCHSDKTNYPWYHSVAPINFWMNHHVEDGKKHLNFSKWAAYSLKRKEHKMEEFWEEVEEKHMPLNSYTWTHSEAKLTDEQITEVVNWAKTVQANYEAQIQK